MSNTNGPHGFRWYSGDAQGRIDPLCADFGLTAPIIFMKDVPAPGGVSTPDANKIQTRNSIHYQEAWQLMKNIYDSYILQGA